MDEHETDEEPQSKNGGGPTAELEERIKLLAGWEEKLQKVIRTGKGEIFGDIVNSLAELLDAVPMARVPINFASETIGLGSGTRSLRERKDIARILLGFAELNKLLCMDE